MGASKETVEQELVLATERSGVEDLATKSLYCTVLIGDIFTHIKHPDKFQFDALAARTLFVPFRVSEKEIPTYNEKELSHLTAR